MSLTPKQKRILDYLLRFTAEKGYAPSQQEIARHFRFKSLGTVQNYIVRLERQGLLQRPWNARRGLEVLSPALSPLGARSSQHPTHLPSTTHSTTPLLRRAPSILLPLVGRVAAGRPIEAIENRDRQIDVPSSMMKKGEHFALEVVGDSMIEDGILSGDVAIVKKQSTADNGQTVVATLNQEATIKRFYSFKDRVELRPANPAYQPIIVPSLVDLGTTFQIEGILVGLIRRL